jgi:hypothetical protein
MRTGQEHLAELLEGSKNVVVEDSTDSQGVPVTQKQRYGDDMK